MERDKTDFYAFGANYATDLKKGINAKAKEIKDIYGESYAQEFLKGAQEALLSSSNEYSGLNIDFDSIENSIKF